jgi:amino acid adenylation domain-containing protein
MHDAVPLLHDYLLDSAQRSPEKVALVCQAQRVTFADLDRRSNALAHALAARGVCRGDRVLVFADNTVEVVIAFWAVLKANAVVSVVNPLTKADKLTYLLNDCRAKALITDSHLRGVFTEAAARTEHLVGTIVTGKVDPGWLDALPGGVAFADAIAAGSPDNPPQRRCIDIDLAAIIYTSGSTGDPKGVMLTHRNMLTAATSVSAYLGYQEQDVVLSALPLSFDYGLYQMLMCVRQGATLVLERSFTFPTPVLQQIAKERCTVFPLVPTMAAILTEMKNVAAFDFSCIRLVTNTAAALTERHIAAILRIFSGAQLFSMYGLTECKRCTYLPPADLVRKPGSVGIAIPNTEVWVVDENGQRVPPGVVGELVVRGATVMRGYWEKPEATAKRLKPGPLPGEMVLYTGDFCRQDEEGYVYFVGRKDDIIKSRGEKVAPKEVESQVSCIPGVKECAVIGVPDELLGQAVKCFVVLEQGSGLTEKQIQGEAMLRLENFMVPKYVVIVPDLPKTTTGKIKKTDLS